MTQKKDYLIFPGLPSPLGATQLKDLFNFALFSEHAMHVTLCLFTSDDKKPLIEIILDPKLHRTGFIWHVAIQGLESLDFEYGYRILGEKTPLSRFDDKKILSDPYARALNTSHVWGHKENTTPPLGVMTAETPFDWEGDVPPNIAIKDLIIYEMQVRSFTQHSSSHVASPGTFLGIIEKIPHLKTLGINAVELMPIFEFDECEIQIKNPKTGASLMNVWGYSTINFFCPMNRFGTGSKNSSTLDEFRSLVKAFHKNGIEVYLDVVYNHTAESHKAGPYFSFRGIDNQVYYMLDLKGEYLNFSGTGNTFNCNHPVVAQLILDSLRYWVIETHVDGFRFDLASILTRGEDGNPLDKPPIVEAITHDPVLANIKLIAEAWDAGGLYQVGNFPSDGRWCEWNGKFRDVVRRFIKGSDQTVGDFARVMTGSADLYGSTRKPYHSINFVTAHDGFSLKDLVSYQDKHNIENGEGNRDGANDNENWNCGAEGETSDPKIQALRSRQMRNLVTALLVAIGTPMILMGDEYGHTRYGNNNTWCQDGDLNFFLWDELKKNASWLRFYHLMIAFRNQNPLFKRSDFLKDSEIDWHGWEPLKANWSGNSRFLAYTLKDPLNHCDLYIAFNMDFKTAHIHLPPYSNGKKWYRVVDTALEAPNDFIKDPRSEEPLKDAYDIVGHSVLIAKLF